MNPRHAAALALVGWYLMVPPTSSKLTPDGGHYPNPSAPISEWNLHSSYDSAKECEKAADEMRDKFSPLLRKGKSDFESGGEWMQSIHCIASDDPRLKEAK